MIDLETVVAEYRGYKIRVWNRDARTCSVYVILQGDVDGYTTPQYPDVDDAIQDVMQWLDCYAARH